MLSVAEVLQSQAVRAAVAADDAGTVVRLVRKAVGVSQAELGDAIGYSQPMVSRIETGDRRATDIAVLRAIARHLQIPPAALGVTGDIFTAAPTGLNLDAVNRQEFLRGIVGLAAGFALPQAAARPAIGATEVNECRSALARLYELDQRRGAGHVYTAAQTLVAELRRVLDTTIYGPATGQRLRELLAAATEHAGWLAFDAGRHLEARHWWLEARHLGDLDGLDGVRTTVLASMSLQASDQGRGREAVQLAQAAAQGRALTSRVRSLLVAREALGHAAAGDRKAARRGFAAAESLLSRGPNDDDPDWIGFWGPADLATHESKASTYLRDYPAAERLARAGVTADDADRWERNRVLYGISLGAVLSRRRAWDDAIHVLQPAVASVGAIASARVKTNLRAAVGMVARQHDYRPAREFSAWAGRMLATA